MVPNPIHSPANPPGQRAGQHRSQVPLVRHRLLGHHLLGDPSGCLWPLPDWLASAGGRGFAHRPCHLTGGGPQDPAVLLPGRLAPEAPKLGLPARVDALPGALGQAHHLPHQLLPEALLLLLPGLLPGLLPAVWLLQLLPLQ